MNNLFLVQFSLVSSKRPKEPLTGILDSTGSKPWAQAHLWYSQVSSFQYVWRVGTYTYSREAGVCYTPNAKFALGSREHERPSEYALLSSGNFREPIKRVCFPFS